MKIPTIYSSVIVKIEIATKQTCKVPTKCLLRLYLKVK